MRSLATVAVAVFVLAAPVRADEEKVPLDKAPKVVLEAAKKRFPKAEVVGASKETDKDKTVYEVELKEAGKTIDVTLTPEAVITTIEKEIDAKDLPKPVADALDKKYAKATFKIVEVVYGVKGGKEALDFYEVLLVTADKKEMEVQLFADGKIKAEEEKKGEGKNGGDLPKPVAEAVKIKFPGTKIVGAEKEDEDGKTVYEIKLKAKGTTLEAVLTAKGEVVKVKVKGGEDEDDDKGKKKKGEDDENGEKKGGGQSGFQGEQKGQHEDKDEKKTKKKGEEDKNEKGKKNKGDKGDRD